MMDASFSLDIEIYIANKAELQKQKFKSRYFSECHQKKKKIQNAISKKINKKSPKKTINKNSATTLLWYSYELHDKPFVAIFW